jgi:hypothetical protein
MTEQQALGMFFSFLFLSTFFKSLLFSLGTILATLAPSASETASLIAA